MTKYKNNDVNKITDIKITKTKKKEKEKIYERNAE